MAYCLNINHEVEGLEHLVLVNIAVSSWKHYNFPIWLETSECSRLQWITCQQEVWKHIEKLPLLKELTEKLKILVTITGREIFLFMNFLKWTYRERHYMDTPTIFKLILKKLCWTSKGVINRTKTFQRFLADDWINSLYRYMISTFFCFQDYFSLYDELSEDEQKMCISEVNDLNEEDYPMDLLTRFAHLRSDIVEKRFMDVNTEADYIYEVDVSVNNSNEWAIEYFLNKLPPESRRSTLINAIGLATFKYTQWKRFDKKLNRKLNRKPYFDIGRSRHMSKLILFLLKQIKTDTLVMLQRRDMDYAPILISLLDWPYQDKLLSTMQLMKRFMEQKDFISLLYHIKMKIVNEYFDFDYVSLFSKVLEITLVSEIKIPGSSFINFIIILIKHANENCFLFIENYMTLPTREKLINDNRCIECFVLSDLNLKDEYLKKLLEICLPELKQLMDYKDNCHCYIDNNKKLKITKYRFYLFLNEIIFERMAPIIQYLCDLEQL